MKASTLILLLAGAAGLGCAAIALPDWQRPLAARQTGPDGSGMVQFDSASPWHVAAAPRDAAPPAPANGIAATAQFKNLTVMTDVGADEFLRSHDAMTQWVSPQQGCGFCHVAGDFAADANPMKAVARQMISMTRDMNATWGAHVGQQGVTCFTCHRGEPVPPVTWVPRPAKETPSLFARSENWNEDADTVSKFFPDNGWALYFGQDEPIHVESTTALRGDTVATALVTKRVYEFMMQMSDGIGVNCGYCHNSRAFRDWNQSTPSRWVAYDAIGQTRKLDAYLASLRVPAQTRTLVHENSLILPPDAPMPSTASGLVVCTTCHYGHVVPDVGAATIGHYPAFTAQASAVAAPAGAAP